MLPRCHACCHAAMHVATVPVHLATVPVHDAISPPHLTTTHSFVRTKPFVLLGRSPRSKLARKVRSRRLALHRRNACGCALTYARQMPTHTHAVEAST